MRSSHELSVVIPAFNEAARLPATLRALRSHFETHPCLYEVVVVDDGSKDETRALVSDMAAGDPRLQLVSLGSNCGKGASVRAGMAHATGRMRLFMDADHSTPIQCLAELEKALQGGADIAIGSRAAPGARIVRRQAAPRERMGQVFNVMMRLVTGLPWRDTQCGFKLFREEALGEIVPRSKVNGFAFDVEWLVIAREAGLRVVECPVEWTNDDRSTVSMVRHPVAMMCEVLLVALRARRGAYKQSTLAAVCT